MVHNIAISCSGGFVFESVSVYSYTVTICAFLNAGIVP